MDEPGPSNVESVAADASVAKGHLMMSTARIIGWSGETGIEKGSVNQ